MDASSFKKISVAQTNNAPAFINDGKWVTEQSDMTYLKKLKDYVVQIGYTPNESSEVDEVAAALKWVNAQWDHDGMNQPPSDFRALDILHSVHKSKQKYRCVEYGIVLSELLQSYGFTTRTVALRSQDAAYGGFGQGHVAMEVWINSLNKWVFLDPQFGVFLIQKDLNNPLNFYELYQQKQSGKWETLKVVFVAGKTEELNNAANYKSFLENYFGHMKVVAGKGKPNISLLLDATDNPLTFQGGVSSDAVFTKDVSLVYPEMNRVTLLLSYKDGTPNFQKMVKDLKIESDDDYFNNMSKFAAKPNFLVRLMSAVQEVNGYEYRFSRSDTWVFTQKPEFDWDATHSINLVEVRAVNGFGRRGPTTFMEIKYQ